MLTTKNPMSREYTFEESRLMARWNFHHAWMALSFLRFHLSFLYFMQGMRHKMCLIKTRGK